MYIERYFLIKCVTSATNENINFPGAVHTIIHGKKDKVLYWDGSHKGWNDCNWMTPHFIREYGYRRKVDAMRNWTYNNPQNDRSWKSEAEIIEVGIATVCGTEFLV